MGDISMFSKLIVQQDTPRVYTRRFKTIFDQLYGLSVNSGGYTPKVGCYEALGNLE